jgi:hypothetical protein
MTHDRMHMRDFHLSHEFLAIMLGVRRPTVTVVAGALQQSGLITYKHGRVTVRDRKGLEAAACPCYAVGRANFERMRTEPLTIHQTLHDTTVGRRRHRAHPR